MNSYIDNEIKSIKENPEYFMNEKPIWDNGTPYIDGMRATYCKDNCNGWCNRSCDNCPKCGTDGGDKYNI
jgi:hypothetical protein